MRSSNSHNSARPPLNETGAAGHTDWSAMVIASEVTICSRLMIIPATRPIASSGALSQKVAMSVWRIRCTTESGVMASIEALDQGPDQQVPPVHQHEQQDLERGRKHHRRQLHHADRQGHGRDHDIDYQKGQKQHRSDLKAGLQFGNDVSGYEDF